MNTSTVAQTLHRLRAPRGGITVSGRDYAGGCYLPESARTELEALARKAAKVATAEPFVIGILGHGYRVSTVPCSASVGTAAFLVIPTAGLGASYHLHRSNEGEVVCSCGDFVHRKAGTGAMCKHGRRLAELGLVASTMPRVLPPFAMRGSYR